MARENPVFHYSPDGYGWAEVTLCFEKGKLSFLASYIGGNPLVVMVSALAAIAAGSREPQLCEWISEPGYMEVSLQQEDGHVHLKASVVGNETFPVEDADGNPKWDLVCELRVPFRDLAENVVREADRLLAEAGGAGAFMEDWDEEADPFPTDALSALRTVVA
jgi:hypothetical protein